MHPLLIVYDDEENRPYHYPGGDFNEGLCEDLHNVFSKKPESSLLSNAAEVEEVYSLGRECHSVVSHKFREMNLVMLSELSPHEARKTLEEIARNPPGAKDILSDACNYRNKLSVEDFDDHVYPVLSYDLKDGKLDIQIYDPLYEGASGAEHMGFFSYYLSPLYAYDSLRRLGGDDVVVVTAEKKPMNLGRLTLGSVDTSFMIPYTFYHVIDTRNESGTVFGQSLGGRELSSYIKKERL